MHNSKIYTQDSSNCKIVLTLIDYLDLSFTQHNLRQILVKHKAVQTDKMNDLTVNNCHNEDMIKTPPIRPPPPKIMSVDRTDAEIKISQSSNDDNKASTLTRSQDKITSKSSKVHQNKSKKLRKRLNTITNNTTDFGKKVYKQISKKAPFKSYTLGDSRRKLQRNPKIDQHDHPSGEEVIMPKSSHVVNTSPIAKTDQLERSRSLNSRSPPLRTYKSFSSDVTLDQLLQTDQQILHTYPILSIIDKSNQAEKENQRPEENHQIDSNENSNLMSDYETAFVTTCTRQIREEVLHANTSLSHSIDLDSIGLMPTQKGAYTVHWIHGWKHLRIAEDKETQHRYIVLKNSYSKTWVFLSRQKIKYDRRWICFPIEAINSLQHELTLAETESFYWRLLQLLVLMAVSKFYENERSPDNIDPNNILLVTSRYGIIVIFHECLNESRLLTSEFIPCESIAEIPQYLESAKLSMYENILPFFRSQTLDEYIKLLITSTWPLDYLLLLFIELTNEIAYNKQQHQLTTNDKLQRDDSLSCSDSGSEHSLVANVKIEIVDVDLHVKNNVDAAQEEE